MQQTRAGDTLAALPLGLCIQAEARAGVGELPQTETPEQALARALLAAQAKRPHEAMGICRDVLAQAPQTAGAFGLLGGLLGRMGQVAEAIDCLQQALRRQPGVASWHGNLSALFRNEGRLDESLAEAQQAARLQPEAASHHLEVGLTCLAMAQHEAAADAFLAAIRREEDNANAHMALGELLLALGEYRPGWVEYEWRNRLEQARGSLPSMPAPRWNGMPMPGRRLFLVADQGFGDMIQFARYIPRVAALCGEVITGWGPEVVALLGPMPGISAAYASWPEIPAHDAYCLLSSLPGLFGTDADSIPLPGPYIPLAGDRAARWKQELDQRCRPGTMRVALAWSGRPTHPNNARRSLRLEQLAPLLEIEGVTLVSVQKPMPEGDRGFAQTLPHFVDLSDELTSFADTAAVLMSVDLLISVDSAVVHLAGALGRPCWVLVPKPSDWRWLLDRTDSVWYPSLRLFRQQRFGEWTPVIQEVAAAVRVRRH